MASMPKGAGDEVLPGHKYAYRWHVWKQAARGPNEGGSKIWMCHSHVDPTQDIYDGLIGPIIITSAQHANSDGTPDDVSKEFVTMFMVFDKSKPGLEMNKGEHVRWHLMGMGNEVDLHTPHWHGNVVLERGAYTDVVDLLPATMKSVDMTADNAGLWVYHCHVADHVKAGMTAMYKVK